MTWHVRLAKEAAKQLKKLPSPQQELILKHLSEMSEDPYRGDVKPLHGKQWKGRYRKRVGNYRIIFTLLHKERIIEVSAILVRSERTYK
jgi:mRNA interferase RelE/StbE